MTYFAGYTELVEYRFDMQTAYENGEKEHPQIVIRKYAPQASDFEAHSVADCWTFFSPRLDSPPRFIRELKAGVR